MRFEVPSSIALKDASALRAGLMQALDAEDTVELDLAAVQEADLSFLQLILALRISAAEAGKSLRLRSRAPAPVAALLERAGFLAAPSPQDLDFWFHGEPVQ